jgi:ribosome-associated protein
MQEQIIELTHEPVELYKLFKIAGMASGGEAKLWIAEGLVTLNGKVETRKRKKTVSGDVVAFDEYTFRLVLASE